MCKADSVIEIVEFLSSCDQFQIGGFLYDRNSIYVSLVDTLGGLPPVALVERELCVRQLGSHSFATQSYFHVMGAGHASVRAQADECVPPPEDFPSRTSRIS
ncbi:hypothetical protein NDU88_003702 [Pleurodeles waltl]|uniref:Uncharacterized protein n=1 Tax=Pleurodeles waltl TaxID=8319 RepID=A0AAV7UCV7_PLEWA|nr:hypothetical protein NDU88_003702 [Pleurodeles waltl]